MQKQFISTLIVFVLFSSLAIAQTATDLIVIDAKANGNKFHLETNTTKILTDRNLYDNQPSFINEKQMAFSAADEKGNHDIIIYNFEADKFTNLTKTSELNEFSPAITDCGLYVSAVTVEEDGKQRLWLYPTNFGEPELLYDDIEPVGYYDWYDNRAAMFVLGSPNKLIYPFSKEDILTISQNVGRTVKKKPKSSIITYIDKSDKKEENGKIRYAIKGYDLKKKKTLEFGYTYPGSEDFIWLNKNLLLMGNEEELFYRKAKRSSWESAGKIDLASYQNISQMAYSPKLRKLVVVMDRK
ncbi:hypothetical protein A33Q_1007 [Indibacter alkaliphilus LW1]|uniref:Uncharacterized protein n=1 Tax=Indibacter alkaliphilus (strain CCUG 57479 / KCTC 22604 / LW1) TaxID=1189612 RepID=S2E7U3_INDAL|nr:hypothetical protein [Indibacter alkaliphilus]EOZ98353.1 hypothetical protein A33Q_1007 [Indibacter alkaliphilus LW1]